MEPLSEAAPPPDLRLRDLLEAIRESPYETPQAVIGRHARSIGMPTSFDYVRAGVEQEVDVLDYVNRVRDGQDVDALMQGAARRGVRAAEAPGLSAVRAQQRKIGRRLIEKLETDPSLNLLPDERQKRIRAIREQLVPSLKIVRAPDEAALAEALEGAPPGAIALTDPRLMRAAGFRESEELAAMGGTAEEDIQEVVRGAEAGAMAARHIIEQKLRGSPVLMRLDEFDDRRFGSLTVVRNRRDELAEQSGLTPASAEAEGKDYELELKKLTIQAIRDLVLAKTAGLWTGPMFLPRELHVDGDEPLWRQLHTAFTPNLEVLGLDEQEQVVFRQESPWEYIFGLLDLPAEAAAGVLGATARGELEGAPFTPTLARSVASAALRGIGEREAFSSLGMESPAAQASVPAAIALGLLGLGVDVLFPIDLPVAVARAGARLKVAARAERAVTYFGRRSAATLLEEVRDDTMAAVAARRRGQKEEATALFDQAGRAEGRVRDEFKEADLGGSLDRNDAEVASRTGAGMDFLRSSGVLPGDLGYEYVGAHLSDRRRAMETRYGTRKVEKVVGPPVAEYNPAKDLQRLDEARAVVAPLAAETAALRLRAVSAATAGIADPDLARRAAEAAERGVRSRVRAKFVAAYQRPSRVVRSGLMTAVRKITTDLGKAATRDPDAMQMLVDLSSDASLRSLWRDPEAWFETWRERRGEPSGWTKLFDEAGAPATTGEAKKRAGARFDFIQSLLRVRDVALRAGDPEQVLAGIGKAEEKLLESSESRARAAHIMADRARKGLTKGDPEELRRLAEETRARQAAEEAAKPARAGRRPKGPVPPLAPLSPRAAAALAQIEATFRVSRDEAEGIARVLDARAETAVAMGADDSVEAWWDAQRLEFRRAAPGEAPDPAALLSQALEEASEAKKTASGAERAAIEAWEKKVQDVMTRAGNATLRANQEADNYATAARAAGRDPSKEPRFQDLMADLKRENDAWMPEVERVLAERPGGVKPLFQVGEEGAALDAPEVWYSALRRAAETRLPNRAPPAEIRKIVAATPGVKAEELEWTEIGRWLKEQETAGVRSVGKEEVLRFLDGHAVKVEETWRGGPAVERTPKEKAFLYRFSAALRSGDPWSSQEAAHRLESGVWAARRTLLQQLDRILALVPWERGFGVVDPPLRMVHGAAGAAVQAAYDAERGRYAPDATRIVAELVDEIRKLNLERYSDEEKLWIQQLQDVV
ncbi:MAG: hypothetical protein QME96_09625, partial [Myxococcota bacterium]|nr:hypothetical protein [Myxococcota bacterium]